ncbi:retroviral-like aspartic protease family protein [Sphingobacterium hungaricum]|uniref:Clan AA aspartic protease n=1 Tax=Sphingobacterium hungaricum TaxID=2082723 RepID=A0A928YSS8_9SPHI|nr:retroviral-like aspartic protease family protein [Sphingobacterium hungaricum]MBE8714553.1 clan AA aspartic protease [Sphingobacterium hungaricum]
MQKIPLEIINLEGDGFHILVDVHLLDKTFKMVLDTGASKTVLDKNTLIEAGIQDEDFESTNIISTGLGTNSMESFMLKIPELRLENWLIKNHLTAVLDLSTINYAYNQMNFSPVVGVLGGDILRQYGAVIDYKKKTLTLTNRKLKLK